MTIKLIYISTITLLIFGTFAVFGTDQEEIPILVKLFKSGDYVEGKYVIVNSLQGYCTNYSETLIGCAKKTKLAVFIKRSAMDFVRETTGYDLFTHEYLHLRCEHEDWDHNWHVGNNEKAVYIEGNDYWKNCGYFNDININIDSEIKSEPNIPVKRKY